MRSSEYRRSYRSSRCRVKGSISLIRSSRSSRFRSIKRTHRICQISWTCMTRRSSREGKSIRSRMSQNNYSGKYS